MLAHITAASLGEFQRSCTVPEFLLILSYILLSDIIARVIR